MNRVKIQVQATWWAALIALFFVVMAASMVLNYRRAAHGTLNQNAYVGVRIPIPERSREAWQAADSIARRSVPDAVAPPTVEHVIALRDGSSADRAQARRE